MTDTLFPKMRRRDVLAAAAAVASVPLIDHGAEASELATSSGLARTMDIRGRDGIYVRMPHLDMESKGNFLAGLYVWRLNTLEKAAGVRAAEILEAEGIGPETEISWEETVELLEKDPVIAMTGRARHSHQKLKYAMLQREYHKMADEFLSEMERSDKMGPGSLEMDTSMHIPEYTAHEIHSMPGGYVGEAFAGHLYHAGTDLGAYVDLNFQDGFHMKMAESTALPADGKICRVLDLGTSIGQFATSMKRRFPDAEVWGIDIGAPMIRYAHLKAVDMNVDVHFAQRLCEETGFPDNHFDVVTSNLLFHEVTTQASKDIIKETYRVLRPGGVFSATDRNDYPATSPHAKFTWWYNYRWNHENWLLDWANVDFPGEMRQAGFDVTRNNAGRLAPNYIAVKA